MRSRLAKSPAVVVTACIILFFASQPALAQSGGSGGGGSLIDLLMQFGEQALQALFNPVRTIQSFASDLAKLVVGTPHPDAVFTRPSNGPWPDIYDHYWQTIIPISLSLYGLSIGLVIFFESTSHLFSSYHRSKLKKRAFTGLLGILAWWWIAALSLRFTDALAGILTPPLTDPEWFRALSFGAIGLLGTVVSLAVDLILFLLIGLVYVVRQYMLYLYVLMMPVLIVLWIPGVGPFALVSRFMRKLANFYIPFLFMTIPVALLFQVGDLLGTNVNLSLGGIGQWLLAIVIPFLAVLIPIIMIWQAGAIFFVGSRISNHLSAQRAKRRALRVKEGTAVGAQGSRNLTRGLRDEPAVKRSGQYMLDSGDSRAHAVGQRLNTVGSRLRDVLSPDGSDTTAPNRRRPPALPEPDDPADPGGGEGGGEGGDDGGGDDHGYDRSEDDGLRDPPDERDNRDRVDDPPRYIN